MGRHSHSHHSSGHHSSSHHSSSHSHHSSEHSNGSEHHSDGNGTESGKNKAEDTDAESNEFKWRSHSHSRTQNCTEVLENGKLVKKCENDNFSPTVIAIVFVIIILVSKTIRGIKEK